MSKSMSPISQGQISLDFLPDWTFKKLQNSEPQQQLLKLVTSDPSITLQKPDVTEE